VFIFDCIVVHESRNPWSEELFDVEFTCTQVECLLSTKHESGSRYVEC
jgi:hypothetical protein